jgi:WD40 repeat protein
MITGYADGLICHWSIELSEKGFIITLVKPWLGHLHSINEIVIRNENPEQIQVFTFSNDCTARIWDLGSDSCARVFKFADPVLCGLVDESRDFMFVGGWDKSVKALDLKKNEIDRSFIASRDSIRSMHLYD